MLRYPFLLALSFSLGVRAQQPAPASTPAEPCPLVVPTSLSVNMERIPPLQCDCRITKFKAKVYSRWGQELFTTEDIARFPVGLLQVEKLESGTYMWVIEYTVIIGVDAVERKTTGYINVL